MAALQPFRRGDTYVVPLVFPEAAPGVPTNITGRRYTFTGKRSLDLTDAQATGANGWSVTVTASGAEAAAGRVTLTLDAVASAQLTPGDYYADVQQVIPGTPNVVATLMYQVVQVLPDVTRSV